MMAETPGLAVPAVVKEHWSFESTLMLGSPRLGEGEIDLSEVFRISPKPVTMDLRAARAT
jgi:hypothetical protein